MAEHQPNEVRPLPPILARPARRLLHSLIALAGWALFAWWWWIVIRSVGAQAVRFTVIFILATTVVVVLITVVWALHNRSIFRRRGPRTQVREVTEDFSRDRLGRSVHFADPLEVIRSRPIIQVRLEHQGKVYRAVKQVPGGAPNGTSPLATNHRS